MKKLLVSIWAILVLGLAALPGFAQEAVVKPYNPGADARAELKAAIQKAKAENKHVLIQVGGNWCPWCLRFHAFATSYPKVDSILKKDYVYALVNYSKENKNPEVMEELGFPGRFGYPVFVILDGDGNRLNTQDSGLLEHCTAKGYDTTKVVTFLRQWTYEAVHPQGVQK